MTTEVIEADINAAARIIGDISVGIYRSPANALKELVSNAFDAGATQVFISTDHPAFSSVSIYDNGPGISIDELRTVFSYIGGSNKRIHGDKGRYQRPIIGKIGIGILAMSQMSKTFVIISSQAGQDFRLEAEIDIEPFVSEDASRTNLGQGKIGHYRIYSIPDDPAAHYSIVTTPSGSEVPQANLGPGRSPRDYFAKKRAPSETFDQFVAEVSSSQRAMTMDAYQSFVWELATLCPLPYFQQGPVRRWTGWNQMKERLDSYRFSVSIDGYELRKPIMLPTGKDLRRRPEDYEIYRFSYEDEDDTGLMFDGYIFHQRKQIVPPELQGLLIRLRNVGIGGYDSSFLKYPRTLGPMARGMSGEIFVHTGLEDALNIDRNSFNETHHHFMRLRDVVYRELGIPGQTGISNYVRRRSSARQETLRADKTSQALEVLLRRVSRVLGQSWEWGIDDELDSPLSIRKPGLVTVNMDHDTVPKGTAARNEFLRVYLAIQLTQAIGPPPGQTDGLVGWLRRL